MAVQGIKLGDKIEDVTAKVQSIIIGRIEYLDGSITWLIQPPYSDNGSRIPTVEVQDAYARRVGDGVYIDPKPAMGFHARKRR